MTNREVTTVHKLHTANRKLSGACACFLIALFFFACPVFADSRYTNSETGYEVVVADDAGLLTEDERSSVEASMKPITAYGNAVFKTVSENSSSTRAYAENYYESLFGGESGTLFVIDMDNRYLYIHNTGSVSRLVSSGQCDIITDNIYTYASDGDYAGCAAEAYGQLFQLLEGGRIAQPMKYICNLLLAVIIALLINYALVRSLSAGRKPSASQLLSGIYASYSLRGTHADFSHQTKVYSPRSSGGTRSGGGGGRSGGSSHSGGGHRF